ncbi:major facilitator superfamily domain-containing protein [Powellomyces hirtus]|nr:major facilitator superfamily domain-containing protein [Powellomyces hirtus]
MSEVESHFGLVGEDPWYDRSRELSVSHLEDAALRHLLDGGDEPADEISEDASQTLDDFLSRIGFGKFHVALLVLCGCGWLADNMWLQGVALILPRVQAQFDIDDSHIGFLSSSVFSGMLLGALFWGAWSDQFGRRHAFNYTLILSTTFGLAAAFAPGFASLCALMFCLGIGVGGHMPVDGCLFVEFCPKKDRSYLTLLSVFFSLGSVVASGIGVFVFRGCGENQCLGAWRWLVGILGLLSLLMLISRFMFISLQESPKFLLAQNDRDGVHRVLDHLIQTNGSPIEISLDEIRRMPSETTEKITADRNTWNVLVSLCTEEHQTITLLLFAVWGLINLGFTMFNAFIAKFLTSKGINATPTSIYLDCFIYASASIPASIAASYLIDHPRLGRRGTMGLSTLATAIALLTFTTVDQRGAILVSSALINIMATISYASLYTYTPEVFPTDVRTTANGACSAVGRITGIIAPILSGLLFIVSPNLPIYVSSIILCLAALCIHCLPTETLK